MVYSEGMEVAVENLIVAANTMANCTTLIPRSLSDCGTCPSGGSTHWEIQLPGDMLIPARHGRPPVRRAFCWEMSAVAWCVGFIGTWHRLTDTPVPSNVHGYCATYHDVPAVSQAANVAHTIGAWSAEREHEGRQRGCFTTVGVQP